MTEKKEIGKLIELLNEFGEYDLVEHNGEICKWTTDDEGEINIYTDYTNNIISKKFGFIKWLVENEKIDIKALIVKGEMRSGWDFDNKKGNEESGEEIWNKYYSELCLMILAIQDEPINFLISILK